MIKFKNKKSEKGLSLKKSPNKKIRIKPQKLKRSTTKGTAKYLLYLHRTKSLKFCKKQKIHVLNQDHFKSR